MALPALNGHGSADDLTDRDKILKNAWFVILTDFNSDV
jgi:hypothetical protein